MFRLDRASRSQNLLKVLTTLKTKAMRSGIWFGSLSYEDRMLTSMISRNIKIVKNAMLATVIARIMGKLFHALKDCSYMTRIERLGRPLAKIYSEVAAIYGNIGAEKWAADRNYARYLGMAALDGPMMRLAQSVGAGQ